MCRAAWAALLGESGMVRVSLELGGPEPPFTPVWVCRCALWGKDSSAVVATREGALWAVTPLSRGVLLGTLPPEYVTPSPEVASD